MPMLRWSSLVWRFSLVASVQSDTAAYGRTDWGKSCSCANCFFLRLGTRGAKGFPVRPRARLRNGSLAAPCLKCTAASGRLACPLAWISSPLFWQAGLRTHGCPRGVTSHPVLPNTDRNAHGPQSRVAVRHCSGKRSNCESEHLSPWTDKELWRARCSA